MSPAPPFWGDYWIIALGDDCEYAVVGHPSRDYLLAGTTSRTRCSTEPSKTKFTARSAWT